MKKDRNKEKEQELLKKLSLRWDFRVDIRTFREKYGIPMNNGFKNQKEITNWQKNIEYPYISYLYGVISANTKPPRKLKATEKKLAETYEKEQNDILKKYKLSPTMGVALQYFILSEGRVKPSNEYISNCCDVEIASLEEVKEKGRLFVKLYIYDGTSLSEARKYLDEYWKWFQSWFKSFGSTQKRVRKTTKRERDRIIFGLSRKSNQDLRSELSLSNQRSAKQSKGSLIRKVLKYKYGICNVSEDNIRKIITKEKRLLGL